MKTFEQRFWDKVDIKSEDECWEWKAHTAGKGYGYISIGNKWKGTRKELRAHRVAYELSTGKKAEDCVMHICDNRSCCNPKHLKNGSQKDNLIDMVKKGRSASQKLCVEDYKTIRHLYFAEQRAQTEIAKHYKIAQSTVSRIILKQGVL